MAHTFCASDREFLRRGRPSRSVSAGIQGRKSGNPHRANLLASLAMCPSCGAKMTTRGEPRKYVCSRYNNALLQMGERHCGPHSVSVTLVESAVLNAVLDAAERPEAMEAGGSVLPGAGPCEGARRRARRNGSRREETGRPCDGRGRDGGRAGRRHTGRSLAGRLRIGFCGHRRAARGFGRPSESAVGDSGRKADVWCGRVVRLASTGTRGGLPRPYVRPNRRAGEEEPDPMHRTQGCVSAGRSGRVLLRL